MASEVMGRDGVRVFERAGSTYVKREKDDDEIIVIKEEGDW